MKDHFLHLITAITIMAATTVVVKNLFIAVIIMFIIQLNAGIFDY